MFNMLGALQVAGLRQVSPCQMFTADQLQRIIMERSGALTAPLNALPGVSATVISVTVNCSSSTVAIAMPISFLVSGVNFLRGFAHLTAVLEPVPILATLSPATLCLRVRSRFVDVSSFPEAVQQQIDSVLQMLFSQRICLPAREPVFQTFL